ncbi:DUF1310 family protein [Streptococcus intermedius]|uniref:DUF1310 family protein n=1 Tax=Streptococcus intermedius TaxID=1338 RepID=UPI000E3BEC84|nr:DUF1310 family protein [Streptococcus intermedius]
MKKVLLILGAVLLGTMIAIGGCKVQEKSQKEQMLEIVKSDEAKQIYEKRLKRIDSHAFEKNGIIQSYKIDYNSVKHHPMGGIIVAIYVNDNKKYIFSFTLNKKQDTGKLYSEGGVNDPIIIKQIEERDKNE